MNKDLKTLDKKELQALHKGGIKALFDDWHQLDPRGGTTYLGLIGPGTTRTLRAEGLWRPGNEGHHCWGPSGDPNQGGKWGVGIGVADFMQSHWIATFVYPGPVNIHCTDDFGWHVFAKMVDDDYSDNSQCDPPMKAILE